MARQDSNKQDTNGRNFGILENFYPTRSGWNLETCLGDQIWEFVWETWIQFSKGKYWFNNFPKYGLTNPSWTRLMWPDLGNKPNQLNIPLASFFLRSWSVSYSFFFFLVFFPFFSQINLFFFLSFFFFSMQLATSRNEN